MKTVAHFRAIYLELPETFIYTTLVGMRSYAPFVVAQRVVNRRDFPLAGVFAPPAFRWNPWRVAQALARRLGRQGDLFSEYILWRKKPALIHAHFGPTGVELLALKQRFGLPMVTTFYGYDVSMLARQPAWRAAYQTLFRVGECFLVEGPHMLAALLELGCPPEKAHLQPIALDLSRYSFSERTPPDDGQVVVLFCGRFTEKKGLEYALKAFGRIASDYPGARLKVIGDGELRPAIERQVAEGGLSSAVTLLGYRTHAETIAEMRQAHLLIQPSVTAADGDSEGGAPTVVLEAQACGLPVLATRHADIPAIVVPGESALLSPERDVECLARNLRALLERPERWPAMGRAGRRHVEDFHGVGQAVARLEQRYSALL